jgi:hypothetical protein
MLDKDTWEIASFIVTVISLPVTIATFVYQARRERANEVRYRPSRQQCRLASNAA